MFLKARGTASPKSNDSPLFSRDFWKFMKFGWNSSFQWRKSIFYSVCFRIQITSNCWALWRLTISEILVQHQNKISNEALNRWKVSESLKICRELFKVQLCFRRDFVSFAKSIRLHNRRIPRSPWKYISE